MIQPEEPGKKGNFLDRLPKLGWLSRLMLLVGIFLIIFVPLLMIYGQQPVTRAGLEHELSLLEKTLAAPVTKKELLEAERSQVEAEMEVAKEQFPAPAQVLEIIESLLELAEDNDIDVLGVTEPTWRETVAEEGDTLGWPVSTFLIDVEGQVPQFQNFILALDNKLHTCQVREVSIEVASVEGEEDTATVVIDVFYGGEHVTTFTGGDDETTEVFHISRWKWCIYWTAEPADVEKARLTFSVYPEGETVQPVASVSHSGAARSDTVYVDEGEGDFYIEVEAEEIKSWKLEIYEFWE